MSQRPPKFHSFPRLTYEWHDVYPGDVVISPDTTFFEYHEYLDRDDKTRVVITKHRPMLVLARLDEPLPGDHDVPADHSTFVVFSLSKGFLVTTRRR